MANATTDEFLARVDAEYIGELVGTVAGGGPNTDRIQAALDDATGELDGWVQRLPPGLKPSAATLRVHTVKVALYLLTLDRPGKEYEQIRNGYTDTISFYTTMVDELNAATTNGMPPLEVATDAPCPVFTDRTLKGFTK